VTSCTPRHFVCRRRSNHPIEIHRNSQCKRTGESGNIHEDMIFTVLLALFITIPILEIALLLSVKDFIGFNGTLALVVATALLGAWLARWQGLRQIALIQKELETGRMPAPQLLDGVLILVAGIVLLTPGLITDAIGFFLLLPPGRAVIKRIVKRAIEKKMRSGTIDVVSWEE